jgi:hypothetical protein
VGNKSEAAAAAWQLLVERSKAVKDGPSGRDEHDDHDPGRCHADQSHGGSAGGSEALAQHVEDENIAHRVDDGEEGG